MNSAFKIVSTIGIEMHTFYIKLYFNIYTIEK
jgi:hypothetical protein